LKAENRDAGGGYLGELQALRDQGFVEFIGDLTTESRQDEIRRDEYGARQSDKRFPRGSADLEQNEQDQRVLEKIVVERREELAPEQRGKTPREKKRVGHRHFLRCAAKMGLVLSPNWFDTRLSRAH